jgi:hypothetical protein
MSRRTFPYFLFSCIACISSIASLGHLAAFRRNVELYPQSANVYDSLADGFEAAGKPDWAVQNVEKAVEVATQTGDPLLPNFRKHLERLAAAAKSAPEKAK